MSNKGNPIAVLKLAAVIAAVLTLCGLSQLLFGSYQEGQGMAQFYKASASSGMGGGWIGGMLTYALKSAVGTVGTYLILIVLFIICGVIITCLLYTSNGICTYLYRKTHNLWVGLMVGSIFCGFMTTAAYTLAR